MLRSLRGPGGEPRRGHGAQPATAGIVALMLTVLAMAGCLDGSDPAPAEQEETGPARDPPSPRVHNVVLEDEVWIEMSDGVRIHNAVYRPETSDPVGVFINFSPYWGDTAQERGDAFSQYMIAEYVPRGFAVVLSAIRGTGHSGGCFEIASDREVQDLHEVVDHFAAVDWSNGRVVAGGKSYDSTTQNGMIAKAPHPALKGIFHVSGITDMYAYNYKGGVPYETGPAFNTYYWFQGTDEYGVSLVGAGSTDDEDAESLARLVEDAACPEFPETQAHGVGSGASGQKTDYWIERDWTRTIGDSEWNGSIFFVHGLQDWNVKPDHILPWIENLPEQVRVKAWLHQGGHVYPERVDWNRTMLAWLDSELNGKDTGIWDGPTWESQATNGTWFADDAFDETLVVEESGVLGSRPVIDRTFQETTRLHRDARITFSASLDNPDHVVAATVWDVAPDGSRAWVTEGFVRAEYRDGLEEPDPPRPGALEAYTLRTYPFDHVFGAGHTLELELLSGVTRAVARPDQTQGGAVSGDVTATFVVGTTEPMAEQPAPMECFAC